MRLIDQYKQLHKNKEYGVSGGVCAPQIDTTGIESVLDYGCGRSKLLDKLDVMMKFRYDPAIEEYSVLPHMLVDLVVCTDVLEHIPEDELEVALDTIKSCGTKFFFNISTRKAHEILPNGENAHCTVKSPDWWKDRLASFNNLKEVARSNESVSFTCDD